MDENVINGDKDIEALNEKLKVSEEKLNDVLNLVHKTFSGNSEAAKKLSEIVGVPAPIVCNEEDEKPPIAKKQPQTKVSYPEANSRLVCRMDFLDKVKDEHDQMMKPNYQKTFPIKSPLSHQNTVINRARSADRAFRGSDHILFNPYAWNLNERAEISDPNLYKAEWPTVSSLCHTKPLIPKTAKSRPLTRCNNFTEMRVEQLIQSSENHRRLLKSNSNIVPDTRDYKLTYEVDAIIDKPPKSQRPLSSISHKRNPSARLNRKSNPMTPFHNLNLQPMDGIYENNDRLMSVIEKGFQQSTIDLQRRLGIPEAGMVGP